MSSFQGVSISPQQRRLWQLHGEKEQAYLTLVIEGRLQKPLLKRALELLVDRHEAFRTHFEVPEMFIQPVQMVADEGRLLFKEHGNEADPAALAASEKTVIPGPQNAVLRAHLIPADNHHTLLIAAPTLCCDGWSLAQIATQLPAIYAALETDSTNDEETLQYTQFTQWLESLRENAEEGLAFWAHRNLPESPSIPLFQNNPFAAGRLDRVLDRATYDRLIKTATELKVTPDIFLLSCWHVLLARLADAPTTTVAVQCNGRSFEDLEPIMGLFARFIPLATNYDRHASMKTIAPALAVSLEEAADWQDYFELDVSATPQETLPYAFSFNTFPAPRKVGSLTWSVARAEHWEEPCTVTLNVAHDGHQLGLGFYYDQGKFDPPAIQRLADQYGVLVRAVLARPQDPVGSFDLLAEDERSRLLEQFNQTAAPPANQCVHQLFEGQAVRHPNRAAIISENRSLTYAELNQRANRLAHYLREQGVGPDVGVAICMDRSVIMMVAVMGILKAGGAYVPLDPDHPRARLAHLVAKSGVSLLLTRSGTQGIPNALPVSDTTAVSAPADGVDCVITDLSKLDLSGYAADNPANQTNPDNLAYMIYTSGSTGEPKGVMIAHACPINLCAGIVRLVYPEIGDAEIRVSLNAPISFDASMQQIIMLTRGYSVDIIPHDTRLDGGAFVAYLKKQRIQALDCTPSHLAVLVEAGLLEAEGLALDRALVAGGAINPPMWRRLAEHPTIRFFNIYGPTEATIDATGGLIDAPDVPPVIGKPLDNYQIYVLDRGMQPVATGVPGEIFIGGDGLARGYANLPALTAERFVPDPFTAKPGVRLYKTGDLARFNDATGLEFMGRVDFQVKIRGNRIELGEIEAAMCKHPMVANAVVIFRKGQSASEGQLIGYFCTDTGTDSLDQDTLTAFLKEWLPAPLLPSFLIHLHKLPLTNSGKIDRKALPDPEEGGDALSQQYVAPETPLEKELAAVWAEVLGVEKVGVTDDFFILGGHSLTATMLIYRMNNTLGLKPAFKDLFENPTVRGLAQVLGGEDAKAEESIPRLQRTDGDNEFALSFAQERLWFIDHYQPDSPAYNLVSPVSMEGPLNTQALEEAFNGVIQRHETLRTTYVQVNEALVQRIHPFTPTKLHLIDLCDKPNAHDLANQLITDEARTPFHLESGPVIRVMLIKLEEEKHILVLNIHHIASDGWSSFVLVNELQVFYRASLLGAPAFLEPLPAQYADYAVWQRNRLQGPELEKHIAYWREKLADPSPLELPLDRPRPAIQTLRGQEAPFQLGKDLTDRLEAFSQDRGVSLFATLLTALKVTLSRFSSQSDIIVGAPFTNRPNAALENVIGFFINTLPLRTNIEPSASFAQLLKAVSDGLLEAQAHQELPFERLVSELDIERDSSRTPLYQVVFNFLKAPANAEKASESELSIRPLEAQNQTAKFEITLSIWESATDMNGFWQYNADLFNPETIERIGAHFMLLLQTATVAADQPLNALNLLPRDERKQLVTGRVEGSTGWVPPSGLIAQCAHHCFENQAARVPTAIAVVCDHQTIDYDTLNRRANQVAHYLIQQGVRPESHVGLCLEPSIEMLVGILGVLKAGGVYVPIDPTYPEERIDFIIRDANIEHVLTRGALPDNLADRLPDPLDLTVAGTQPDNNPQVAVDPGNGAYVIYTSGSTGNPKGVVIPHVNIVRLFRATEAWFQFDEQDNWTLFHSFSFDFSVWEIWGALFYGGRLTVVPFWLRRSPHDFRRFLSSEKITVLSQSPSAFYQLVHADQEIGREHSLPLHLRYVVFGAEALNVQAMAPWFERYGDTPQMVNMFGITETTVHVTYRVVTSKDLKHATSPIGVGIPDLDVYVLDPHLNLAPKGAPGELYVGGPGLARGYLNRPDLSADRFIPNPFATTPGSRLYKTGDQVRLLGNDLVYLTRIDHQIKIRGFRIEPGEIQTVLDAHEGVRQSAVLVSTQDDGHAVLTAYVTPADTNTVTPEKLRSFVEGRLPAHMVPGHIILVDQMPMTASGKLDRKALSQLKPATEQGEHHTPPANELEQVLASIFAEVLGVEGIGVETSFFALGGDSILSIRVMAMAREVGIDFSLQELFQHQTVRQMARLVNSNDHTRDVPKATNAFDLAPEGLEAWMPNDAVDAYPMSRLQLGMIYHMEISPETRPYHNVNSWQLKGVFQEEAFRKSADMLVTRHPIFRTSFHLNSPGGPLQVVHKSAQFDIECQDLRALSEAEQTQRVDALIEREKHALFDLTRPPLLRFAIQLLPDENFRFTLTECHAILDGWSLTSSLTELFTTYFEIIAGKDPAPLPPPKALYRNFIALEQAAAQSEASETFWRHRTAECQRLALPDPVFNVGDDPKGGIQKITLQLAGQTVKDLQQLAGTSQVTMKSVLLAAHVKALSIVCGQTSIVTGLQVNGREEVEDGEKVYGLFLNAMPFAIELTGGTWSDLVKQVFKIEWEGLKHRRFPFAHIQEWFGSEPLLTTGFNYVHFHSIEPLFSSDNLQVTGKSIMVEPSHFPFMANFDMNPVTDELQLTLHANQICSYSRLKEILGYYTRILQSMAASVTTPHHHQWNSYLPTEEETHLLQSYQPKPHPHDGPFCLHTMFTAQAAKNPENVAVIFQSKELTYAQLDQQSNALAGHLLTLGVQPETPVGLFLSRSLEMAIGLMGVLKAGGAYLPLDTSYPEDRLAFMIENAGAPVILTLTHLADRARTLVPKNVTVITLDDPNLDWAALPDRPLPEVSPANPAYVIYTSGSTGRPKGVLVPHQGIANTLHWRQRTFVLDGRDRILQTTSFSFDASVWELFGPLVSGAALVLSLPEGAEGRLHIQRLVTQHGVTAFQLPPSWLDVFLDEPGIEECTSLRYVISGAEPIRRALIEKCERRLKAAFHNLYGPTEASLDVTAWHCDASDSRSHAPIGMPIDNTRVYILDKNLQPLPMGVPGQLLIAGHGVARGYLNHPALTATAFIPDPFAKDGSRLYVTGDVACHDKDGAILFLGRADAQVKLRGYRIEIGEIESVLATYDAIKEVAVLVREEKSGEKQLVAYLVPKDKPDAFQLDQLRGDLTHRLPDFMIPSAYVIMEALPMSPNGKLDRKALPQPRQSGFAQVKAQPPTTELEKTIADLWQEMFQLEEISIHVNFFELGGNSLLLVRLHQKLREALGVDLAMVDLFEHTTIAELAAFLSRESESETPEEPDREEAHQASKRRRAKRRQRRREEETDDPWENLDD